MRKPVRGPGNRTVPVNGVSSAAIRCHVVESEQPFKPERAAWCRPERVAAPVECGRCVRALVTGVQVVDAGVEIRMLERGHQQRPSSGTVLDVPVLVPESGDAQPARYGALGKRPHRAANLKRLFVVRLQLAVALAVIEPEMQ